MFTHLEYIDGSSDKFWEISTNGKSHTVTYGKNGTSGQSKTKEFDSEEECEKDAKKLINEKIKKGYSEDGTSGSKESDSRISKSGKAMSKKEEEAEVSRRVKELIYSQKRELVIPFLKEFSDDHELLIRKEVKVAAKYWLPIIDFSDDPEYASDNPYAQYGRRGNKNHQMIINLLSLATFNLTEATRAPEFRMLFNERDLDFDNFKPLIWEIIQLKKPNWLLEYFRNEIRIHQPIGLGYWSLREMEDLGYIRYDAEILTHSLPDYSYTKDKSEKNSQIKKFIDDKIAIERDLNGVFEYETPLHTNYYIIDSQTAPKVEYFWLEMFKELKAHNKIDIDQILDLALETQTKNWNNNLKALFRTIIDDMDLKTDQILKHQESFFPLLHSENSTPINYAIKYLKVIIQEKDFKVEEFLNWVEPVFMRNDLKTGIKTLISQFEKLLKTDSKLKGRIIHLVSDIFMIQDLQLQEKTAKFILKYGDLNDDELSNKLELYSSSMLGTISKELKGFLPEKSEEINISLDGGTEVTETGYEYSPMYPDFLKDPIEMPENWNDVLFHIGKVLKSDDPLEMEILYSAWLQHMDSFPDDHKKQIAPYVKQANARYVETYCVNNFRIFLSFLESQVQVYNKFITETKYFLAKSNYADITGKLSMITQNYILGAVGLPLLSLPTHYPHWIDPQVLVERILKYEKQKATIYQMDLAIALNRVVPENLEGIEEKIELISSRFYRDLIKYAIGLTDNTELKNKPWLDKHTPVDKNFELYHLSLWANIARSRFPDAEFKEFENRSISKIPFFTKPFRPEFKLEPKIEKIYNYYTQSTVPQQIGTDIKAKFPSEQPNSDNFIYGLDVFQTKQNNVYWTSFIDASDIKFMHSIMPLNTEPLELVLLINVNGVSNWNNSATAKFTERMLSSHYRMSYNSAIFIATCMYDKSKPGRAMMVELFIQAILENRMPVKEIGEWLGFLISNNYGPLNRVTDIFGQVKDVSSKHNQALIQLLTTLINKVGIADKMPNGFKKILEILFDLQQKEGYHLNSTEIEALSKLNSIKSLQPIINKILKP
jgi:predicted DNA-binding WGR domain protein